MFKGGIVFELGEHRFNRRFDPGVVDRLSDRELEHLLVYYEERIQANQADLKDYELYVAGQRERSRRLVQV